MNREEFIKSLDVGDYFIEDNEVYKCTEKPIFKDNYYSWKGQNFDGIIIDFGVHIDYIDRFKVYPIFF